MGSAYPFVQKNSSLNDAIEEFFRRFRRNHFLVVSENAIIGVIHMEKVKEIPFSEREKLIVGDVTEPLEKMPFVNGDTNGLEAFTTLTNLENNTDLLLVRDELDSDIIGFIELEDFKRAISFSNPNEE